jgi:hypothetical protein
MPKMVFDLISRNKRTIRLTFEIFWIIVYLLKIIAGDISVEVPQFIYVNF